MLEIELYLSYDAQLDRELSKYTHVRLQPFMVIRAHLRRTNL